MLNIDFENLEEGGYCFGEKIYLRVNLQDIIHPNLIVTSARKIGLNAPRNALSILYNGRNITNSLIKILIEEHFIKKSDDDKIIFVQVDKNPDWDFDDLEEKEGIYELFEPNIQPFYEKVQVLEKCLQNCESFKGNVDDMNVKYSSLIITGTPILQIFYKHRNITQSLLDKLEDLNLLYCDNKKYYYITDSKADVGLNFRMFLLTGNVLYFFIPLSILCLILMVFSKILAIIVFLGAVIDFVIEKNLANRNIVQRNKYANVKELLLYIFKWAVICTIGTPILISLLGSIGFLIIIGLIIFSIYHYRHI